MYGPFTNEELVGEALKPYRDRARSIIIKSTAMMHIAIQEQLDGKTVD